ncbi:MAG: HYR domain-containing protein, partial [Alphaproteobacteria bacterium]|nr:HYR domain-containing protein [Alphaproteobacteria bacterium]
SRAGMYEVYATKDGGSRFYVDSTTDTSFTYSGAEEGKKYVMYVRPQYADNSYGRYFESNYVIVPIVDRVPPMITVPDNIKVTSNSSRSVTFKVTAYDAMDGSVAVSCNPASGEVFSIGITTVKCSARDAAGNSASKSFTITVVQKTSCNSESGSFDDLDRTCVIENIPGSKLGPVLEIAGGEKFGKDYFRPAVGSRTEILDVATITIGAEKDGVHGLVVSAHTISATENSRDQKLYISRDGYLPVIAVMDTLQDAQTLYYNAKADAAFVPVRNGVVVSNNTIKSDDDSSITIISKGGVGDTTKYERVKLVGAYTNSEGNILYRNATIRDSHGSGPVNYEQILANYASKKGDSGGPVISIPTRGTASLYGLHVGQVCIFDIDMVNLLDTFGSQCDRIGFKAFSTWENVEEKLGIR